MVFVPMEEKDKFKLESQYVVTDDQDISGPFY